MSPKFNTEGKTVKELKDFARKNKIRGFSNKKKSELQKLIRNFLKKKPSKSVKPINRRKNYDLAIKNKDYKKALYYAIKNINIEGSKGFLEFWIGKSLEMFDKLKIKYNDKIVVLTIEQKITEINNIYNIYKKSESFMQPQERVKTKSSKQLLSELKKKIESKDLPFILSKEEISQKNWYLVNKKRTILIFTLNDSEDEDYVKQFKNKDFKLSKPKWVELSDGRSTNIYVFGSKLKGTRYHKNWVDKILRYFKDPKIYYKYDYPLMIKGKIFIGFISSMVSLKKLGLSVSLEDVYIPYNKYLEISKISMKKLKDSLVFKVDSKKDNVIRQYYKEQLVLGKKELDIKKLADLLDYKMEEAFRGFVNRGYIEDTRESILIDKQWVREEGKNEFRNLKPVIIDLDKLRKSKEKYVDLGSKDHEYYRRKVLLPFKIFKQPKLYINKSGLLIAKMGNIYLVTAPAMEK